MIDNFMRRIAIMHANIMSIIEIIIRRICLIYIDIINAFSIHIVGPIKLIRMPIGVAL